MTIFIKLDWLVLDQVFVGARFQAFTQKCQHFWIGLTKILKNEKPKLLLCANLWYSVFLFYWNRSTNYKWPFWTFDVKKASWVNFLKSLSSNEFEACSMSKLMSSIRLSGKFREITFLAVLLSIEFTTHVMNHNSFRAEYIHISQLWAIYHKKALQIYVWCAFPEESHFK